MLTKNTGFILMNYLVSISLLFVNFLFLSSFPSLRFPLHLIPLFVRELPTSELGNE